MTPSPEFSLCSAMPALAEEASQPLLAPCANISGHRQLSFTPGRKRLRLSTPFFSFLQPLTFFFLKMEQDALGYWCPDRKNLYI